MLKFLRVKLPVDMVGGALRGHRHWPGQDSAVCLWAGFFASLALNFLLRMSPAGSVGPQFVVFQLLHSETLSIRIKL